MLTDRRLDRQTVKTFDTSLSSGVDNSIIKVRNPVITSPAERGGDGVAERDSGGHGRVHLSC